MNDFVWVSGASSGIGKSLAMAWNAAGYPVIATARRDDLLQQTASEVSNREIPFLTGKLDISDASGVNSFIDAFTGKHGNITGLVNNAGVTSFKSVVEDSLEDIDAVIQTNLLGSIYCTKAVLPGMIKLKQGLIVNILSVAAKKTLTNSSVYSASKAGLAAYANVLREEVRKYNIAVVNVYPGATTTPIWSEQVLAKYSSRMMSEADVANAIVAALSAPSTVIQEELTFRPILGDL